MPPVKPSANSASGKARTSKSDVRSADRAKALTEIGGLIQLPLMATGQLADAAAFSTGWPNLAVEAAKLADNYESVAKIIDPLISAGPFMGIATAALPMIAQIAVNHKLMKAGVMGTVPPNSLSSQMEAAMAQQEMQALQLQLEAERDAAKIRAEIQAQRKEMNDLLTSAQTQVVPE